MKGATAVVLDASVLVAAMRPNETHHASARSALEALTRQRWQLIVPVIALAEVAAAISRGTGSSLRAEQELALLRQTSGLVLIPVDAALGDRAAAVAATQRIRGCDAVYVALAHMLGMPLITLDQQQQERAPAAVSALTPAEALARLSRP